MRIFSKLNSNEYNNQLEKILENKTFDESVKNLLLSMLYKIENGYADYSIVKFSALPKADFMEKILNMYVAGYSQKEIAKTLGCTSVAIAKKIQEFRREFEYIEKLCEITHSIKARYRYDS